MGGLAFVFPGQGVQHPGMGQALYRESMPARHILDTADALMPGLLTLCFEGPEQALTLTNNAQPALFCVEMALAAAAESLGLTPQAVAGFSLGEWSAIAYAGMLPFERAFGLVVQRGQWMQACAKESAGGMSAVLRATREEVLHHLQDHPQVTAVNFNAPQQVVVAGPLEPLAVFEQALKTHGLRSMRLKVSGAFHCAMMQFAGDRMASAMVDEAIEDPAVPVYSNLSAAPYEAATAKEWLSLQVTAPVQWVNTIHNMALQGIDTFLELGPGRVLSGLINQILPDARTLQADEPEGLKAAAAALGVTV